MERALAHQNSLMLSTPTNILMLGSDHANQPGHEGQRSDSIMVIRTDPSRHRIVYLSIPRDLRVPIEGVGDTKINAAMQTGGAPLAIGRSGVHGPADQPRRRPSTSRSSRT